MESHFYCFRMLRSTNVKFLMDMNLQLRYGIQWDKQQRFTFLGRCFHKQFFFFLNFINASLIPNVNIFTG